MTEQAIDSTWQLSLHLPKQMRFTPHLNVLEYRIKSQVQTNSGVYLMIFGFTYFVTSFHPGALMMGTLLTMLVLLVFSFMYPSPGEDECVILPLRRQKLKQDIKAMPKRIPVRAKESPL
jgi:hypothetical protein